MTVLPFEPRRLWPHWTPPDGATRRHVLDVLSGCGAQPALPGPAWQLRVWYPGFLPRYLCVRAQAAQGDPWRFHALVSRAPGGRVFVRPSWQHLCRHRSALAPWITVGSAVSWLSFALAAASPDEDSIRVVAAGESPELPAGIAPSRARALAGRAGPPEVLRHGRDGVVLWASVTSGSGLTVGAFHIRPDGEVLGGAGEFLPWFSDDMPLESIVRGSIRTT